MGGAGDEATLSMYLQQAWVRVRVRPRA